ncbi:MAG TPA: hypothetical protein ENN03_05355 [bacterium]|mgnify:CR=1 FL=1|nr:hypothetical protein [bacterium]
MDCWWKFWWLLTMCCTLLAGQPKKTSRKSLPPVRTVCAVLLLSYSDYLCPLCLQSFLQTADSLNSWPGLQTWCVLIGDSETFMGIPAQIVRAQFKGWIAASGLNFQALVDEKGFLNTMIRDGPVLIVFSKGSFIRHWSLPLSPNDLKTVKKFIKQSG